MGVLPHCRKSNVRQWGMWEKLTTNRAAIWRQFSHMGAPAPGTAQRSIGGEMRSSETTREEPAEGSKRHGMSRLPRDWRERLFAAVQARKQTRPGKLPEAIAALWTTGCRPAELEAGIAYMRHKGMLVVQIRGAKHGVIDNGEVQADRGMEWRTLAINPQLHAGARYLYDLAPEDGTPRRLTYNRNSIRSRVNELGREVVAKLKDPPSISPYSFRHAMASDLKSCDALTDEQRAQVMGHLSVESLESYGRRRRGGGGVSPVMRVKTPVQPKGERSHAPPAKKPASTRTAARR